MLSYRDGHQFLLQADWLLPRHNTRSVAIGEVKTTRGKVHEYLGMKLDCSVSGQVSIDMVDYIKSMVSNFPEEDLQGSKVASPWNESLFKVDEKSPKLEMS